jgi:kynurenine formamidase
VSLPIPVTPISKTVTSTAAFLLATNVACIGVWLQSSSFDDSNAAMTGTMYVCKELVLGSGTWTVLCEELVTGQSTFIPCANTAEIKIKTQTGTGWVRGYAIQASQQ